MEASGAKFTWIRTDNGRITLRERLDRVLSNMDFREVFSEAKSIALPRTHNDHHLILLDTELIPIPRSEKKTSALSGCLAPAQRILWKFPRSLACRTQYGDVN